MHIPVNFLLSLLFMMSLADLSFATDASILKPPPGARVAVVVFDDLQCSDDARAFPIVGQAASAHEVPVVSYDFPLPMHNWAFDAAVWARFFDAKSEKLGNQFRAYLYSNQIRISLSNLQDFVQRFGDENKVPIPATNDPDGKLAEKVKADYRLAQQIGLVHAPTIFVVGRGSVSAPMVEVVSHDELNQVIEDMLKKAGREAPAKRVAKKKVR